MDKEKLRGHISALFTVGVWGTTFIATKILLENFTPVEIMFVRFLIGLVTLSLLHPGITRLRSRSQEKYYVSAALTGITLYYLFENNALTYTYASHVGVIIATIPFFTGILSFFVYKDRSALHWQFFAGFLLAMSGIVLISVGEKEFHISPLGDLLALGAALCWAAYTLIMRKIGSFGYDPLSDTRRIFTWGVILSVPVCIFSDFYIGWTDLLSFRSVALFLYLGILACAVCYILWNKAINTIGAVQVNLYLYLNPVIALTASALILKEPVTARSLAGTALILSGLFLSQTRFPGKQVSG